MPKGTTAKTRTKPMAKRKPTKSSSAGRFSLPQQNLKKAFLVFCIAGAVVVGLIWLYQSRAATCTIDANYVNSCRPWLSAATGGYPQAANQDDYFNKRLNNPNVLTNPGLSVNLTYKMDIPHTYHTPGQTMLNGESRTALNSPNLYNNPNNPVLINYKPGDKWGATANGAADDNIRASAQAVKAYAPRKVMIILWHEPENLGDMNAQGITVTSGCKTPDGTRGSAAEYRAMWRHVHDVFQAQGANNVLWVWNVTGAPIWNCVAKPLWPGNDLVDWVMWNPYSAGGALDFPQSTGRFYTWLTNNSDSTHDFLSKPWGLGEHGSNGDAPQPAHYWDTAVDSIGTSWSTNKFPRIKLYAPFDSANNGGTAGGLRVGYNNNGAIDVNEQTHFNAFAKAILTFNGGGTGTVVDATAPTVSISSPAAGATVSGTATITASASDNVGVTKTELWVDGALKSTDGASPWSFAWDTTAAGNGSHTLLVKAYDAAGNSGQSGSRSVNVSNVVVVPPPSTSGSGTGLKATYYNGPNFTGNSVSRVDANVNFAWGSGSPASGINADNFSVRWTGTLIPAVSGTYTFTSTTDDGMRVYLTGEPEVDEWHDQGPTNYTFTRDLEAGKSYGIRIEYYENSGGATAKLLWSGPGIGLQAVPSGVLRPTTTNGYNASYYRYDPSGTGDMIAILGRVETSINNDWGGDSPDPLVPNDDFAATWVGKVTPAASATYTFTTKSDDGVRLWVGGNLLIDNWTNHSMTTNTATMPLTAGKQYDIHVDYYENGGDAAMQLLWNTPGAAPAQIPASQLSNN